MIKIEPYQKRIFICTKSKRTMIFIFEGEKLRDLIIEPEKDEGIAGDIFKGIVRQVMPSLEAAFLDIRIGKNVFLPKSNLLRKAIYTEKPTGKPQKHRKDIEQMLSVGQEVLVQLEKESIGTKGGRVTTDIALPGRYLVYMPFAEHKVIGISQKITDENERKRLRDITKTSIFKKNQGGIIFRTICFGKSNKEIINDFEHLVSSWKSIRDKFKKAKPGELLHRELRPVEKTLRDYFSSDVVKIVVDDKEDQRAIRKYLKTLTSRFKLKRGLVKYMEHREMADKYNLREELKKVTARKVWLDCGGYLLIEEMEALCAIDVNTGKNIKGTKLKETILKTNIEAAIEIAKQLRLRGIGGIIVVDFIDMYSKQECRHVESVLREEISKDKAACDVHEFTDIGLVQITRQRIKDSLGRQLANECPRCQGSGKVIQELFG